jgi:flagellum-specific peptidoglycan hydrolase FlgJ
MGQEPNEIRAEIEDTRARMGDTVDALAYKADVPGRMKETISDKTQRFRDQMSGTASKVSDSTPDTGDVKQGAKQAVGVAQENPIGLALGGVALGFLAGMVVPSTSVENERVGPIADDVKDRVKETGQEAIERGKQVAQDAAQSAAETAKESGREQAEEMQSSGQQDSTATQPVGQTPAG